MSSNSTGGQVIGEFDQIGKSDNGWIVAPGESLGGSLYDSLQPGSNSPAAPPTPPSPTDATMTALGNQLKQEVAMRSASSNPTGGRGITALPQVKTAGQSLLGF